MNSFDMLPHTIRLTAPAQFYAAVKLDRLVDAEGLMALGHHAGAIMPLNKAIFLCPDGGRAPHRHV